MRSPFVLEIHSIALFPIAFNEVIFNDLIVLNTVTWWAPGVIQCLDFKYNPLFWIACLRSVFVLIGIAKVVSKIKEKSKQLWLWLAPSDHQRLWDSLFNSDTMNLIFWNLNNAISFVSSVFFDILFCASSIVVQKENSLPDNTGQAYRWLIFFTILRFTVSLCHHLSQT